MKKTFSFLLPALSILLLLPGCASRKGKTTTNAKNAAYKTEMISDAGDLLDRNIQDVPDAIQDGMMSNTEKEVSNKQHSEDADSFVFNEDDDIFSSAKDHPGRIETTTKELVRDEKNSQGFSRIFFDFDSHAIRNDQKDILVKNTYQAKKVLKNGGYLIVEGHACRSAGSAVYNMMLSEKRAEKVASNLSHHGVPAERIKIVGRGYEMPLVPSGNREEQAPNRRVEMYMVSEQ